jgi:hypothetical protein
VLRSNVAMLRLLRALNVPMRLAGGAELEIMLDLCAANAR